MVKPLLSEPPVKKTDVKDKAYILDEFEKKTGLKIDLPLEWSNRSVLTGFRLRCLHVRPVEQGVGHRSDAVVIQLNEMKKSFIIHFHFQVAKNIIIS